MSKIILDYSTETQLRSALASAPRNLVERGDTLEFVQTKAEILFQAPITLGGIITGPDNGVTFTSALNASYTENPNVLNLPFSFSATAGAAWRIHGDNRKDFVIVDMSYVTMQGMQIMQGAGDNQLAMRLLSTADNFTFMHSILESAGQLAYCYPLEINAPNATFLSSLIAHRSSRESAIYMNGAAAVFENVSIVRTGDFTKGGSAFNLIRTGAKIQNCVATGFDALTNSASATGDNNACSGTISFGSNKIENVSAADIWINPINDFRTKSTSVVVDSGGPLSIDNVRAPNGVRQQGTSVDRGAWEQPSTLVAPTATVTNITVVGRKVTISGTTTGAPTVARSTAVLTVDNMAYNSGVAPAGKNLTMSGNTFMVEFDNMMIGSYGVDLVAGNSAYTVAGTNPVGSFQIEGPKALTVNQSIDGQRFRMSGTTSGNPTSGTMLLLAEKVGGLGATDRTLPLTISGNTYSVDEIINDAGNYAPGILRFSTTAGTSLPQPGPTAFTIIGLSGNPQALDSTGGSNVTVSGVDVTPATATVDAGGTVQLIASVVGNNSPAQDVQWTTPKGNVSASGLFTAHQPTAQEIVTVTAKSLVDPTYSDTAVITVRAKLVVVPTDPIVTDVVISPTTATGSTKFNATALGTNPPQTFLWTAEKGTVDSAGNFVAPAQTGAVQVFKVIAMSSYNTAEYAEATVTIPALEVVNPPSTAKATTATIKMVSPEGVVQANLTGLECAFFDQTNVGQLFAPTAKTMMGTTNAQGELVMNITGTNLLPGQSGRIIVAQGTKAFTGIVVVS
jgi:hypothetical protein